MNQSTFREEEIVEAKHAFEHLAEKPHALVADWSRLTPILALVSSSSSFLSATSSNANSQRRSEDLP